MTTKKFRMLYDGDCPFCVREMQWLQKRDAKRDSLLEFEDISKPEFDPKIYGLTYQEAHHYLHGILPNGTVVNGLEVTRQTFQAVGLGWLSAPTKWPLFRYFFDLGYHLFARYRVPLGKLFGRKCTPCSVKSPVST